MGEPAFSRERPADGSPLWNLLVVADEAQFLDGLLAAFPEEGVRIVGAMAPGDALAFLGKEVFQILVLSTGRVGTGERRLLKKAMETYEHLPVFVLLDRWDDIREIRDLVRPMTWSVMLRPQPMDHIRVLIQAAMDRIMLHREIQYLRHQQPYIYGFDRILGKSAKMREVLRMVRRVASSDATVLIQGESGTGKELFAAAIHYNSPRRGAPFVAVNCANLHENLLESELFGHEKGAFTGAERQRIGRFEQANGGTLFLDEVGDMAPAVQGKLLRVLEQGSFERLGGSKTIRVNVRVLAATNQDLRRAMEERRFRQDLYYRLCVVPIHIPPLRERREDIPMLAEFFLRRYGGERPGGPKGFQPSAMERLEVYPWPGNVRELENVVERAVLLCRGEAISPEDLMLPPGSSGHVRSRSIQLPPGGVRLKELERDLILQALERANWVQRRAAQLLGLTPRGIHYKIRKHRIQLPRDRG